MTVRAIQVPIDPTTLEALRRIAQVERREPREQAAHLLRVAMRDYAATIPSERLPLRVAR